MFKLSITALSDGNKRILNGKERRRRGGGRTENDDG